MKLVLKCIVSLRTKSEKKLPLAIISLFLLFEIARNYNLFNMTALSGKNPKSRNTEHRGTEGPTRRRVNTPKSYDTSYKILRQNIISYCCCVMSYWYIISLLSFHAILIHHIALIHHIILIYLVLISYTLITIIHNPGIISHPWCWYHVILI